MHQWLWYFILSIQYTTVLPFNISNMKKKHGFKGNYLIAKNKSETL
jgi:hypothetical protein